MEQTTQQYDALMTFFQSDKTKHVAYRKLHLMRLKDTIKKYEHEVMSALYHDLGNSQFEAYTTEIGIVYEELNYMIRHMDRLSRKRMRPMSLAHFPSTSFIKKEPYGAVLVIAPWNYPFQLSMSPLVGAIASGNVVALKPSEYSKHTTEVIAKIIKEVFPPNYVQVFQGGVTSSENLLKLPFDYIFFTGSTNIGKKVMHAASEHLTPVTLELGGKSPCIVDDSANMRLAARRIAWGKYMNAGQTCVAPDYVYVSEASKPILLAYLKQAILELYGLDPLNCKDYSNIINQKQYDRLISLIDYKRVIAGGRVDEERLRIEPTILDNMTWNDEIMKDEIFGPILPILTYNKIEDVISTLKNKPKPLALYLFSENKPLDKRVVNELSFGGGCINDTIIHVASTRLPFGGVGASGMGQYHGKYSFDTFSHDKIIVKKSNLMDIKLRYPPYKDHIRYVKKVMK